MGNLRKAYDGLVVGNGVDLEKIERKGRLFKSRNEVRVSTSTRRTKDVYFRQANRNMQTGVELDLDLAVRHLFAGGELKGSWKDQVDQTSYDISFTYIDIIDYGLFELESMELTDTAAATVDDGDVAKLEQIYGTHAVTGTKRKGYIAAHFTLSRSLLEIQKKTELSVQGDGDIGPYSVDLKADYRQWLHSVNAVTEIKFDIITTATNVAFNNPIPDNPIAINNPMGLDAIFAYIDAVANQLSSLDPINGEPYEYYVESLEEVPEIALRTGNVPENIPPGFKNLLLKYMTYQRMDRRIESIQQGRSHEYGFMGDRWMEQLAQQKVDIANECARITTCYRSWDGKDPNPLIMEPNNITVDWPEPKLEPTNTNYDAENNSWQVIFRVYDLSPDDVDCRVIDKDGKPFQARKIADLPSYPRGYVYRADVPAAELTKTNYRDFKVDIINIKTNRSFLRATIMTPT